MDRRDRVLALAKRMNPDVTISVSGDQCSDYLVLMNSGAFRRTKTPAYFRWFYRGSGRSMLAVARGSDDTPVGQMGVRLCEMSCSLLGGLVTDMVTVPSRRGSGVFALLEQVVEDWCRNEGADLLYSFPNIAGARALIGAGHWAKVDEIRTLECNAQLLEPHKLSAGGTYEGLQLALSRPTIGVRRSAKELAWRFQAHPEYKYREWPVSGSKLWTKIFTDPASGENTVDLVSAGGLNPTEPHLLGEALAVLSSEGAVRFSAWAQPTAPDAELLLTAGFYAGLQSRALCVRWLSSRAEQASLCLPWTVAQADTEVF